MTTPRMGAEWMLKSAAAAGYARGKREGDDGEEAESRCDGEGETADGTHDDRHDAGDQGHDGGNGSD